MIIGVTGRICAGKGEFASILGKDYGFVVLTTRDEVMREAEENGLPIDRDGLQDLGNQRTVQFGEGYWAKKIMERIQSGAGGVDCVVEALRYPGQVEFFREHERSAGERFVLVGITASYEVRKDRYMNKRRRAGDEPTEEAFERAERRDGGETENGQRTADTYRLIDYQISNERTLDDLEKRAEELLGELRNP